jgi:hypothetical protein
MGNQFMIAPREMPDKIAINIFLPAWMVEMLEKLEFAMGVPKDHVIILALSKTLPERVEGLDKMRKYFPDLVPPTFSSESEENININNPQ